MQLSQLYGEAQASFHRGEYQTSIRQWRMLVALMDAADSPPRQSLATILNGLGMACKFAGNYDEAQAAYIRAMDLLQSKRDPAQLHSISLDLATLYHNLGGLHHARGRHAEGEIWARQGLAIRQDSLGPDHIEVAADMSALAALLDAQTKFNESETLHRKAIAIFERDLGATHLETGLALGNFGAMRSAQGRLAEALDLLERAASIKRLHLGESHPSLGWTWNNLAVLERTRGNQATAQEYFARALSLLEPALGPAHRHVITCRSNYEAAREAAAQV